MTRRVLFPKSGDVWVNSKGRAVRVLRIEHRAGWGDVVFFRYVEPTIDPRVREGADQVGLFMRDYWTATS